MARRKYLSRPVDEPDSVLIKTGDVREPTERNFRYASA